MASGGHLGTGRGRPRPPTRSEASLCCCSELPRPARPPPLSAAAGCPQDGPGQVPRWAWPSPVPSGDLCQGFPYFLLAVQHWGCWCSPHRGGGKGAARGPRSRLSRVLLSSTRHLPRLGLNPRRAGPCPVPAPPERLAVLGREPRPGSAGTPLPGARWHRRCLPVGTWLEAATERRG